MAKIKLEKIPVSKITDSYPVKLKCCGNVYEILYSMRNNRSISIEKIDADYYLNLITGEILKFKKSDSKADCLRSVAHSLELGRDLINTNVVEPKNCRWLTLTYRDNMTDTKQLLANFRDFNKRLRKIYGHYEYITCAEPQARGAWHLHCILIFNDTAPFLPNNIVSDCWKRGFINIQKLDNIDNIGAYLTAYLGDLDLEQAEQAMPEQDIDRIKGIKSVEFLDENGQKKSKRYIKGGRLYLYPAGMHIFRHSKGIKQPTIERMPYFLAKEKIGSAKPTFSKAIKITADDYSNILQYEYYNSYTNIFSAEIQALNEKNNIK